MAHRVLKPEEIIYCAVAIHLGTSKLDTLEFYIR